MSQILPGTAKKSIRKAVHLLREGEVVAFPTEMGYVLGANAFERFAVRQLRDVAGLSAGEGLLLLIYQIDDLNLVAGEVPNRAWSLLSQFWPGPLIVRLPKTSALPTDVTGGQETVAICSSGQPASLDLVIKLGRPLAVNLSYPPGGLPLTTAQAVARRFGTALPLILEDDELQPKPATIIDLSRTPPQLRQRGNLDLSQIRAHLPDLEESER